MIDARFASHQLFREAAEAAYKSLWYHLYLSRINTHPVAKLVQRAKAVHAQRRDSAVSRFLGGMASLEDLLQEEWEPEEIQTELADVVDRFERLPYERALKLKEFQDKVYNRVRRWFKTPVPKVATRRNWRDRLKVPDQPFKQDR